MSEIILKTFKTANCVGYTRLLSALICFLTSNGEHLIYTDI